MKGSIRIEGISDKHLGPRIEYARIVFECMPADDFEVDFGEYRNRASVTEQLFLEAAIFGFLDIALLHEPRPLRSICLRVVQVDFDDTNSSQMAFRHAGQDAARKVLTAGCIQ